MRRPGAYHPHIPPPPRPPDPTRSAPLQGPARGQPVQLPGAGRVLRGHGRRPVLRDGAYVRDQRSTGSRPVSGGLPGCPPRPLLGRLWGFCVVPPRRDRRAAADCRLWPHPLGMLPTPPLQPCIPAAVLHPCCILASLLGSKPSLQCIPLASGHLDRLLDRLFGAHSEAALCRQHDLRLLV